MESSLFYRQQIIDNCHLLFPNEPCIRVITSTSGEYVISAAPDGNAVKILLDCPPNTGPAEPDLFGLYQKTRQRVTEKVAAMKTTIKDVRRNGSSSSSNSSGNTSPLYHSLEISTPKKNYKKPPVYKTNTFSDIVRSSHPNAQPKVAPKQKDRKLSKEMLLKMSASITQNLEKSRREDEVAGVLPGPIINAVGITAKWVAVHGEQSLETVELQQEEDEQRGRRRERDPPFYNKSSYPYSQLTPPKEVEPRILRQQSLKPLEEDMEGFDIIQHPSPSPSVVS